MSYRRPGLALTLLIAPLVLTTLHGKSAIAQATPTPRIVDDRREGEEERIRARRDLFYETRTAGTSSSAERARLRRQAVEETRAALQLQKRRWNEGAKALGGIGPDVWVHKGPTPSTFGGWAFGNVSGRVTSLAADWAGGVLYLGTASGGVWRSTNDGLSWTSIFDSVGTMTIGDVALDPSDPSTLWVGTGENIWDCDDYFGIGLLRSTDGGATWELRNGAGGTTLDDLATFADIVIDPRDSDHVVTGGRIRGCDDGDSSAGGIFTSNDAGATWTERLSAVEVHEIVQDPTVLDTFWAATDDGVFKSTDNAVTWTLQTASGLPNGNTDRTEIAIAPRNSSVVYALFDKPDDSFWRTTDGGATWAQRGGAACDWQCWYNMVLRVDPTDPDVVYRGTVRSFKSLDGGLTWTALTDAWGASQTVHQDTHVLLMHPTQPDTFYIGTDGGLWKSVDGGASFTNLVGNLGITQFYAIGTGASDPESIICGGSQDNSSLVRTASDVWEMQFATGDGFRCYIDPQDPDRAWLSGQFDGSYPRVYRSTDGLFGPWTLITNGNGIVPGEHQSFDTPYLVDPSSPNILYLATDNIYRSTDYGSSWTSQAPDDMTNYDSGLDSIEINRNFPTYLWTGGHGQVWRTEDSGSLWTNVSTGFPNGHSATDLASDPTDPDRVFVTAGGFNIDHLWEWTETAGAWTSYSEGLPNVPANTVLVIGTDDVLVGNDVGIFRSADGGRHFWPYMEGFPLGSVVTDLKFDLPDLVTVGTYGRGVWQVHVDPLAAIVQYDSVELPLVEVDGDGDDKVEPGETWSVSPALRNIGGAEALGVTARLSSSTPGVTVLAPSVGQFGDLDSGETAAVGTPLLFMIDPDFPCGDYAIFDVVDIHSTNAPSDYPEATAAFSVQVLDHIAIGGGPGAAPRDPVVVRTMRASSWERRTVGGEVWMLAAGSDSVGSEGVSIPREAVAARMSPSGGRLVIDARPDGNDDYVVLDAAPFPGSFDLTRYRGQRVWLAFVRDDGPAEPSGGALEFLALAPGDPVCDVTPWPGSVPVDTLYRRVGTDVEAIWSDSCNLGDLEQTYSIQSGDLDSLRANGSFTHAPIGGLCALTSPEQFTPGAGNEYYLVVPNGEGREGGAGAQSSGAPRPQVVSTCGVPREATCP